MKNSENTDHYCVICNKHISTYYHPDWAYQTLYKGHKKWFCGYPHMREWQKAHERTRELRVEE